MLDIHRMAADGVLAGDTPLLVGRGAERQVAMRAGDPLPGLHAVAGGIDVRQVGLHAPAHLEGAGEARLDTGGGAQRRLRACADDRQHQVRTPLEPLAAVHC